MNKKLLAFVRFAESLGELSHCKRANVGCVIVPSDFSAVYAIGYNGPPRGEPNNGCRQHDGAGACGCVHAEANAMVQLGDVKDAELIVTAFSPCEHCAGLIVNSQKIRKVWYNGAQYRDIAGLLLLMRHLDVGVY